MQFNSKRFVFHLNWYDRWHASRRCPALFQRNVAEMIGQTYPNNMPASEDELTDKEIIAVLSFIKSTWPIAVKQQHDQMNARSNASSKRS